MNKLIQLFLLFIIYSVIGWFIEMIPKSIENKRFVNRGFLIGPYLPIYGSGAVIMTLSLQKFSDKLFILFLFSLIICAVLEYITSYIMEKLFKARWWDYSKKPLNLNGRIWIGNMIAFGICGVIVIKIGNPLILKYLSKINDNTLLIASIILFITFLLDLVISYNIINNFKKEIVTRIEDSSEKMSNKVKEMLNTKIKLETNIITNKLSELYNQITNEIKKAFSVRTILYRRLITAFPDFQIGKSNIKKSIKQIKNKLKIKIRM